MPAAPARAGSLVTALLGALVVLPGALAGCGDSRTPSPDITTPANPSAVRSESLPEQGIAFHTAANWTFTPGTAPLVATTTSGQASVAIWRYPRSEALPRTRAQLGAARTALEAAARARDPGIVVSAGDILPIDGHPAIELLAQETIAGQTRTVRSAHIYAYGAEYVIDAFAPPDDFDHVDGTVFIPLMQSVQLAPVPGGGGGA